MTDHFTPCVCAWGNQLCTGSVATPRVQYFCNGSNYDTCQPGGTGTSKDEDTATIPGLLPPPVLASAAELGRPAAAAEQPTATRRDNTTTLHNLIVPWSLTFGFQ